MKAKFYKSFIKDSLWKLYKKLTSLHACVTKVDNNIEINSVRSSLDLGNISKVSWKY